MKHDEEIIKLEKEVSDYLTEMPKFIKNLKISPMFVNLINENVDLLLAKAYEFGDEITNNIIGLCEDEETYLIEIEHRYKGRERIVEKVCNSFFDNLNIDEAIDSIEDTLRFTYIVVDSKEYLQKVVDYLNKLENLGYQVYEFLNFWGNEYYQGINVILKYKGIKFEVQFHTVNSYHIKEGYTREPYIVARNIYADDKIVEKANAIRKYYQKQVIVPDGAIGFQYKKTI